MKNLRKGLLLTSVFLLLGCSFASYKAYAEDKTNKGRLQPANDLTVFDGTGKRVGIVLGFFGTNATVTFRLDGEVVIIGVNRERFDFVNGYTSRDLEFYFESSNCTGMPFTIWSGGTTQLAPIHVIDGTNLYGLDGPLKSIIVRSRGSIVNPSICTPVNSFQWNSFPLRFLIDLSTQFQPPFTVR